MTKDVEKIIKELAQTSLTEQEIIEAVYAERASKEELELARKDLIDTFCFYIETLIPECDATKEDTKFLEEQLILFEKDLEKAADILKTTLKEEKKPTSSNSKDIPDEVLIKKFLKDLGI